jgi:hypothetical protein
VVVLISKIAERQRVKAKANSEAHQVQHQSRRQLAGWEKADAIPVSPSKDQGKGRLASMLRKKRAHRGQIKVRRSKACSPEKREFKARDRGFNRVKHRKASREASRALALEVQSLAGQASLLLSKRAGELSKERRRVRKWLRSQAQSPNKPRKQSRVKLHREKAKQIKR